MQERLFPGWIYFTSFRNNQKLPEKMSPRICFDFVPMVGFKTEPPCEIQVYPFIPIEMVEYLEHHLGHNYVYVSMMIKSCK